MRHLGFSSPTTNVTWLLIVLIAIYLAFALIGRSAVGYSIFDAMLLKPHEAIFSFEVWRLFSYAFLHDLTSPMHLIFNALMLYMVGSPLEDRWGEKRFLIFIAAAILLGALLVCLAYVLGISNASVAGFSAATIGLLIAWGLTFSTQNIYVFGVLPLTGKQLVFITVGLEVLYAVSANSISSAAHFGGILAGFIFTLGLYKPRRIKQIFKNNLRR